MERLIRSMGPGTMAVLDLEDGYLDVRDPGKTDERRASGREQLLELCAKAKGRTNGRSVAMRVNVAGAEKHALLRTADLFVLPSYSEGFPMAVLEAAAHRIPVVQTDECNFPELTAAGGAWECRPEHESLENALRDALTAEDTERTTGVCVDGP
jgi:glycosyltransferase involved in cell wall biosynthesis